MKKSITLKEIIISIVICIVLVTSALPTATLAQPIITPAAHDHILTELTRQRIPSAAVAVIQGNEVSLTLKNTYHDSLFQIGSISKSFTGFGVLLLEDMGLLCVTDPISRHLPWFEVRYRGVPVVHDSLTIYTFLQHTSGFTSDERRFPRATLTETTDEFAARLTGMELAFYPSTAHVYGNINYIILGLLIEAVSGQSYDEFMTEHVLHPLGLYNTFTDIQRAHETGRVIGGNRLGFLRARPWNPYNSMLAVPTGLIYSDITDMSRWAKIQLGSVEVSEQFERIVARSHEHFHSSDDIFAGIDFVYAAGWRVRPEYGTIVHGGLTPGYSATLKVWAHENIAVVVLSNLQSNTINRSGDFIFDTVIKGYSDGLGMDFLAILDIGLSVLSVVGLVYAFIFVPLVVKIIRRLKNGGKISFNPNFMSIKSLYDPLSSIMILIAFYTVPAMIFSTSHAFILLTTPLSMITGGVALWVMAGYSLVWFLGKTCIEE